MKQAVTEIWGLRAPPYFEELDKLVVYCKNLAYMILILVDMP